MSMVGNLVRVSEEMLHKLHSHPELITSHLYPEPPKPNRSGFLGGIFGKKSSDAADAYAPPIPESDTTTIDKTWHSIHFLLTGTDWGGEFPGNFLLDGGKTIGDVDVGYGPAHSYTTQEVVEIDDHLKPLDEATLRSRLDPPRMRELEIYPDSWDDDAIDEEWDYILWGWKTMKDFVTETRIKSFGLIVYTC